MIKVIYKSESWLMRILSWVLFFNPNFMTGYATTIGNTIYLPDAAKNWSKDNVKTLLAHEHIHAFDNQEDKLFPVKYLFPQILALLTLLVVPFTWWGLLFLIFLAPLPAPWRRYYEVRGYIMSLAAWHHVMIKNGYPNNEDAIYQALENRAIIYNNILKGSDYYWCWPWGVEKELTEAIHSIRSGDIFKDGNVYSKARDAVFK